MNGWYRLQRLFLVLLLGLTAVAMGMPIKRDGKGCAARPVRILLAGDSLMEGLGPQMQEAMKGYRNITLIPIGKKSTGLSRPDFYDWPEVLEKNLKKHNPHIVVMWVGTNDPQNIYGKNGLGEPCSIAWQKAYFTKLMEIVHLTRRHHARLIFMGPPVMAKEPLNSQLLVINRIMRWTSRKYRAGFLDTRAILADRYGKYRHKGSLNNGKSAILRTPDQIHITADGNKLVMDKLLPYMGAIIPGNNTI